VSPAEVTKADPDFGSVSSVAPPKISPDSSWGGVIKNEFAKAKHLVTNIGK
jgi:hypothetical protein